MSTMNLNRYFKGFIFVLLILYLHKHKKLFLMKPISLRSRSNVYTQSVNCDNIVGALLLLFIFSHIHSSLCLLLCLISQSLPHTHVHIHTTIECAKILFLNEWLQSHSISANILFSLPSSLYVILS